MRRTTTDATTKAKKPAAKPEDATNLDQVVVTGIRRGIERSIDTKKNSTSIVEAVSAEDIGKLPDVSIAESIARLPGLAAQRVAGRAQVISVRGLSPDFSTTLLNGREMVSTGDNRSVEFDQYPSELHERRGGLQDPGRRPRRPGPVGHDRHAHRAPAGLRQAGLCHQRARHAQLAGFGGQRRRQWQPLQRQPTSASPPTTPSASRSATRTPTRRSRKTRSACTSRGRPIGDSWRPGVPAGTYYSDGIKALRRTGYTKRDAVMATLEYRPNDVWHSTLDVLHSQSKAEDTANQFEVNLSGYNGTYGAAPVVITGAQVNGNGTFTGGTVGQRLSAGARHVQQARRQDQRRRLDQRVPPGRRRLVADISWSKADARRAEPGKQPAARARSAARHAAPGLRQQRFLADQSDPAIIPIRTRCSWPTPSTVPATARSPKVVDELKGYKLAANIPGPASMAAGSASFDVGINYADREKEKHQPEGSINARCAGPDTRSGATCSTAWSTWASLASATSRRGTCRAWSRRYMTFDPNENASYLVSKAWTVDEKITTALAEGQHRQPVGLGAGARQHRRAGAAHRPVVDRELLRQRAPAGQQIVPHTDGKTYTDCAAEPEPRVRVHRTTRRCASPLAKQVARPRVDQMRASFEFGVDTTTGRPGASGGNPRLDPWKRQRVRHLVREVLRAPRRTWRPRCSTRSCQTYIYTQTRDDYDFSEFVAGYVPPPGSPAALTTGTYTAPFNGKGGNMKGLELSASLPLNLFTPVLDGFGVIASATLHRQQHQDPAGSDSVHPAWARSDHAAGPVQARVQLHRLLRAQRLRGAHQPASAFRLHRRDRQFRRRTARCVTSSARTSPTRRSATPSAMAPSLQGPDAAAPGQQPDQRVLPHLRRHQGSSAREHRVGPHLPARRQLQVLIARQATRRLKGRRVFVPAIWTDPGSSRRLRQVARVRSARHARARAPMRVQSPAATACSGTIQEPPTVITFGRRR